MGAKFNKQVEKVKQELVNELHNTEKSIIKNKKYYIIILILITIMSIGFTYLYTVKKNEDNKEIIRLKQDVIDNELGFIREDLEMYDDLSNKRIEEILVGIKSNYENTKYRIPLGLTYSIIRNESDCKWQIDHPEIKTSKFGTISAVGLGGVVWEFWKDSLKKNNIADKRSDLYVISVNIEAVGYILRIITNNLIDNHQEINLQNISEGYFGKGTWAGMDASDYKNKLTRLITDLWMRRVIRQLKQIGKV